MTDTPTQTGVKAIERHLQHMPEEPGVYRMLNSDGDVLYVGKAKNLKKRVISYTQLARLVPRIQRMVMQTAEMEIVTTRTEAEALLLEANLIKSLKPRYNILLRDDKSFPYIAITGTHDYPRITKHRGEKKPTDTYFGPFASAGAVNHTITVLQKAFLLRPCSDSVFSGRTRPCLEYQIKRCSAPCVNYISKEDYQALVKQGQDFLSGKSRDIQAELTRQMEEASARMDYEEAAQIRDRIKAMASIQAKQGINAASLAEADIVALHREEVQCCVQVFFVRGGQTLGHKAYFPTQTDGYSDEEVMEAFLGRFYQNHPAPPLILLSHDLFSKQVMEEALQSKERAKIRILIPQKGEKRQLVETALANAQGALHRKLQEEASEKERLAGVATLFGLTPPIRRIEVYDNSHIFGKHAVGAMIVAGEEGFMKQAYRKFTVDPGEENTGGDDFWMLRQMLTRRFKRLKKEHPTRDDHWPDLLLIDGGAGHLTIAQEVMEELELTEIPLVCIAKGPDRNAGREDYYQPGKKPFKLPPSDPVGYYLQRLRDEAHRFAINAHRGKRANAIRTSVLDDIPGIGATRKKALLHHFGSARGVEEARLEELMKVDGISRATAKTIYDYFHEG